MDEGWIPVAANPRKNDIMLLFSAPIMDFWLFIAYLFKNISYSLEDIKLEIIGAENSNTIRIGLGTSVIDERRNINNCQPKEEWFISPRVR